MNIEGAVTRNQSWVPPTPRICPIGSRLILLPIAKNGLAFWAHVELAIPTMAFFAVRVSMRLRFILFPRRMKEDLLVNFLPVLVGLSLFLTVLYLYFFFR